MKIYREIFNDCFRQTMNETRLKGAELARETGRSANNITEIRKGKSFPAIGDLADILAAAEEIRPGFFEAFVRSLLRQSQSLTASPEEIVKTLDASELGPLIVAAGARISKNKELGEERRRVHNPITS